MLSDVLPTGFECGVLNGAVKPGDVIAVVGAGPVGLAALLTAQFYSPAESIMVDLDDNRLEVSRRFGATQVVNSEDGKAVERVMALTEGRASTSRSRRSGSRDVRHLPGDRHRRRPPRQRGRAREERRAEAREALAHNVTITTGLVDTVTTPMLLRTVVAGRLQPRKLITHEFKLDELMKAYDTFGNAAQEKALKVILRASST